MWADAEDGMSVGSDEAGEADLAWQQAPIPVTAAQAVPETVAPLPGIRVRPLEGQRPGAKYIFASGERGGEECPLASVSAPQYPHGALSR